MKLKNLPFYALIFATFAFQIQAQESAPSQRTISNWRLAKEYLAGYLDLAHGHLLKIPYFREGYEERLEYEAPYVLPGGYKPDYLFSLRNPWAAKITNETLEAVQKGQKVSPEYIGTTLLWPNESKALFDIAVEKNNLPIMKAALSRYPELAQNRLRYSPLKKAVNLENEEMVKLLLEYYKPNLNDNAIEDAKRNLERAQKSQSILQEEHQKFKRKLYSPEGKKPENEAYFKKQMGQLQNEIEKLNEPIAKQKRIYDMVSKKPSQEASALFQPQANVPYALRESISEQIKKAQDTYKNFINRVR